MLSSKPRTSRPRVRSPWWIIVLLGACLGVSEVRAGDDGCPDAELFSGKLITDVCWACVFPIRIGSLKIGDGQVPDDASDQILCSCTDPAGVPDFGLVIGLWEPARLVELVRAPGCAPSLGGIRLPVGSERMIATPGKSQWDTSDTSFFHYHWYAFPLLVLLDLFYDGHCIDGYLDFDLLYLSELDPTWNNDELAFFTNPEAAWLANPTALSACMADAVAANVGKPLDSLFWCAGSWGFLYPFSGHGPTLGSRPRETSLLMARATAALHRRGLARRTMGDGALCNAPIEPFLPKTQYKASMFFPRPEAHEAHVIGQSTFTWGEHRNIPGTGEDHLYILWRWNDCCATGAM
jgi:conjugal transfer pilus assembly protein TraU